MKQYEKVVKQLNGEIKKLEETLVKIKYIPINLITEMFPEGYWSKSWSEVEFYLPYSFVLIEQFKAMMVEQFPEWECYYENNHIYTESKAAIYWIKYCLRDTPDGTIYIEVNFRSDTKGSTCVLNPIGSKMVEKIEYEVVCSQAAADEFGMGE